MKERGILMKGEMVRALLRKVSPKTKTRRVVMHPESFGCLTGDCPHSTQVECDDEMRSQSPFGEVGDRLWVKETWRTYGSLDHCKPSMIAAGAAVEYRAGGSNLYGSPEAPLGMSSRWRTPIFMPRWASRITLEVVGVRVERVQAITWEDAVAEGVQYPVEPVGNGLVRPLLVLSDKYLTPHLPKPGEITHESLLRAHFAGLWDRINLKRGFGWAANPWVWVVEFRRVNGGR